MNIKQVTKVSTVCDILNTCEMGKEMFKEYHKLIKLYLTIPVTTARAEHSFSTLNRLKNSIRASMTQSRKGVSAGSQHPKRPSGAEQMLGVPDLHFPP